MKRYALRLLKVKKRWRKWTTCLAYDAALPTVSTAISNAADDTITMY
jgi:hypothetical protein